MFFKLRLYQLIISLAKKGVFSFFDYLPLDFWQKLFLKSILKRTNLDETEIIIAEIISQSDIWTRLLSYFASRVDLFDEAILNSLPSFHQTSLTVKNTENLTLKNLYNLDADKNFILWLLSKNSKKKPTLFNKNLLSATKYFFKKFDLETDLRFQASNASAIFDDFYSDNHFKVLEVDWLKTNENILVYDDFETLKALTFDADVVLKLYHIFYKMIFIKGYLNFDFSKENLALTKDDKITFFDYSTCIKLDSEDKNILKDFFLMLLNNEYYELITFINLQKWGKIDDEYEFIALFNNTTFVFEKFELLLKMSQKLRLSFPNEYFLIWLGLKNIKKLSTNLNLDEKNLDNELKAILFNETNNFFDANKRKMSRFPQFSDEIKKGLQTNALPKKNIKKKDKSYFFQTKPSNCKPRKKDSANVYIYLWFVLFIIIFAFMIL